MSTGDKVKDNESFFEMVLKNMKENACMCYPYGEDNVVFQKLEGKFHGDPENYNRVKELVSPEFLQQNFKLKN